MKNKAILYTDQYDAFGGRVRAWLEKHKIDFEERNVASPEQHEALFAASGQYAIPAVVFGKHVILGYDSKKLREVFARNQ